MADRRVAHHRGGRRRPGRPRPLRRTDPQRGSTRSAIAGVISYFTPVSNNHTGKFVWGNEGKDTATLEAATLHNLSNALVESTDTKIRVLHRMAFEFAEPERLIAVALVDRDGYRPPLPGRQAACSTRLGSSALALASLG